MKLSVLAISYNHEKYIAKAIESILAQQTNFDFEVIVGDDCSTDKTSEILLRYQQLHPHKLKVIVNDRNLGVQRNFENVYNSAVGEYIALLETDDYWCDPLKLQQQVDILDADRSLSMCFSNGVIIDDNNMIMKEDRVAPEYRRRLSQRDIISGYCPPTNTAVFRHSAMPQLPSAYFKCMNGDFICFIHITTSGDAGYLDRKTAYYRKHEKGIWSDKSDMYITVNFAKTCQALLTVYGDKYEEILLNHINGCYSKLLETQQDIGKDIALAGPPTGGELSTGTHDFTDNGFWTPQTKMLQEIQSWIAHAPLSPGKALSIDNNPDMDRILLAKWPGIEITRAIYPDYDVQNLYQFEDNSFDIVYSHQVLEHVPKPWLAGQESVRVLKSGGIGVHTSCAFNPRHGQPAFNDYYRFLPDGLAELFDNTNMLQKGEWGNREAILYNVAMDDGHGPLGGRRFHEKIGSRSDGLYPWHTWVIFQKLFNRVEL